MDHNRERFTPVLLLAAAVVAVLGFKGILDLPKRPVVGFGSTNQIIGTVRPGSPAAEAGLAAGDKLVTIDGLDVNDREAMSRLTRLQAGIVRHYGIERDGQKLTVDVEVGSLSPARMLTGRLTVLVGLGFLVCGLAVWFRMRNEATSLFAWIGICAVLVFGNPLFVTSTFAVNTVNWLWRVASLLAATLFLHLVLVFPERRSLVSRRSVLAAMYAPVTLQVLLLPVILMNPGANVLSRMIVVWQPPIFLVLALIALITSFVRADAPARRAWGLNVLLGAAALAIVPYVILTTVPGIPGAGQASLVFLLLPLALSYALLRGEPAQPEPALSAEAT